MASNPVYESLWRRLAVFLIAASTVGCSGLPENAYRLPPSTQSLREAQTRTFEVPFESNVLQVAVALMQDMEYNFDTSESELGVLCGSKVVDADSLTQQTGLVITDLVFGSLSAFTGTNIAGSAFGVADDKILLTITLVVLPRPDRQGQHSARVTIQSELIDKAGRVRSVQMLQNPYIYQKVFDQLSRSLALEGLAQ